jgi:hypothetical protein
MTVAHLIPGDIIIWDKQPALVEAVAPSFTPNYVTVKLSSSPVMFLWMATMEVLHVGNIQGFNLSMEFLLFYATQTRTQPHLDPVLLPAVWRDATEGVRSGGSSQGVIVSRETI